MTDIKYKDEDFVSLNVGGTSFLTTVYTLKFKGSKEPSTYFSALFGGSFSCSKDANGAIMIDRNPEVFKVILAYLRTGIISIPKNITKEELIIEAEFYCMDGFITALEESLQAVPRKLQPGILKYDGYYLAADASCYHFTSGTKFIWASNLTNLKLFLMGPPPPSDLKAENWSLFMARCFTSNIIRGTCVLSTDKSTLEIRKSLGSVVLGVLVDDSLIILEDAPEGEPARTYEYTFHPW